MSEYKLLAKDGMIKVSVLTKVSSDRIMKYLYKGSWASKLARVTDNTPGVPREVRKLLVHAGGS